MATYALTSNPNRHYYTTRRGRILGIVLHVTAGLEDFTPPDLGAESTIRYGLANARPASWHGIVDSDSVIDCLPDSYTAFHVIGYNSQTLGLEIANRDARWAGKPQRWVDATIANAAAWCRPRVAKYGLPVNLADKAEVDRCIRAGRPFGFTYHSMLDPKRRIDPGRDFPWARFETFLRGVDAARLRVKGPFPLAPGHWFGVDDNTARSHSGIRQADREGVRQIQAEVGVSVDGVFGSATQSAVKTWQGLHSLTPDGLVGVATWNALLRF